MEPREEFKASVKHLTRRRFLGRAGHAGAAAAGAVIALRLDMLLDVQAAPYLRDCQRFLERSAASFPRCRHLRPHLTRSRRR